MPQVARIGLGTEIIIDDLIAPRPVACCIGLEYICFMKSPSFRQMHSGPISMVKPTLLRSSWKLLTNAVTVCIQREVPILLDIKCSRGPPLTRRWVDQHNLIIPGNCILEGGRSSSTA